MTSLPSYSYRHSLRSLHLDWMLLGSGVIALALGAMSVLTADAIPLQSGMQSQMPIIQTPLPVASG